ncbi:hypothetical protein XENOCAPTIV_003678, partial [Xenoophorus captivus]
RRLRQMKARQESLNVSHAKLSQLIQPLALPPAPLPALKPIPHKNDSCTKCYCRAFYSRHSEMRLLKAANGTIMGMKMLHMEDENADFLTKYFSL